ncbi:MCE family protein [Actinokineospora globicatena]|uniref:MCE family protein n=1 Tax=Actinokineospora globicatena TaxID=103729 RepID=UPI0020A36A04|nr:MCE family protein [Actinokineospora globicatena]MCP2301804.1 virulence factor Mce family protein [Actinokineospora globicatena]GLW76538.1 ABC transporter substrate-binding protein [Actinokineospora globicatena]GLW83372.1 ABC transporter substrate-binding protein [Actinokineospora globicatena]
MNARTIRRRLNGLLFIVVAAALVGLSIAMYAKVFTPVAAVTLSTDKVGNQLAVHSDVKVRGLVVGEVRRITPTSDGAELDLALDPDKIDVIPSNVSARFLPKTLFGERYVSLQIPEDAAPTPLAAGDRIEQDTSVRAVELEDAFESLLPVLQAVQPQKLSSTLTAIATALEGRGEDLGKTLADLGELVGELNPHLPKLQQDLRTLATVADTYSDATPDLVAALTDLTVTSKTIADQRANLDVLFATTTTAARDLDAFLRVNKNNLIQLADTSRPTLEALARYSPEYPCLLQLMAEAVPELDKAFGKGTNKPGLHATIEITVNRGPYRPGKDEPRYDEDRGPRCYDFTQFPSPFPQSPPDGPLRDGATNPPPARSVQDGLLPPGNTTPNAAGDGADLGIANSPQEAAFLAQIIAPELGTTPEGVPGWSTMLLGPAFRGAEVRFP